MTEEMHNRIKETEGFDRLYSIIKILRSPGGCPWDIKQTPDSLKESLLEEAYECFDAITEDDSLHVCEELGDIFLLATFISIIYEEDDLFRMNDVFNGISEKLIRRHPHVFSDAEAGNADAVKKQWEEIKQTVEGRNKDESVLDSVPKHFPPLAKALKVQKKAAKNGFDWPDHNGAIDKLHEEIDEFTNEVQKNGAGTPEAEEEFGDILFSLVNVARFMKIDPSTALIKTINKFTKRYRYVEKRMKEQGKIMAESELEYMDSLWNEAKTAMND